MFSVQNIYLAAMLNGIFLMTLLLSNRRGNRPANILLAVLVALLTQSLWNVYVWKYDLPSYWLLFNYSLWATAFLWGPVLYLYVSTICAARKPDRRWIFQHCALALILFVIQLPIHLLDINEWLREDYFNTFYRFTVIALYVHLALYIYACFQILASHEQRVREYYSYTEKINLTWLRRLTTLFALVLAVDMCFIAPAAIQKIDIPYLAVIMLAESVTIFLMGFFSLSHPEILFQFQNDLAKPKYTNSPLDDSLSVELKNKLNLVMAETEIYKKNDLRLPELASLVDISPHHLSQLINEQYQKNFYEFVNGYRVEYAAHTLKQNEESNITQVAFESGFNNRVSFNNAFKKAMRMTPSQFRREESSKLSAQPSDSAVSPP